MKLLEEGRSLRIALAVCEKCRWQVREAQVRVSEAEEELRAARQALVWAEATAERLGGEAAGRKEQ